MKGFKYNLNGYYPTKHSLAGTGEKEFSGILRVDENEFTVSNHKDTVRLTCNSGTHKNRF
jgi:hypothetical protein